jgi:hypothetical protein
MSSNLANTSRLEICVLAIACLLASGCSASAKRDGAPAMQGPATQPGYAIALEIAPSKGWPDRLQVTVTCDAPAAPGATEKLVRVAPIPASRLDAARQAQVDADRRARAPRTRLPEPEPTWLERAKRGLGGGEVDGTVWIVVAQTTAVEPHERIIFDVAVAARSFRMIPGQRNLLTDQIGAWQYLPGTIEVYALWTEYDVEVVRSATVRIDVPDRTAPAF